MKMTLKNNNIIFLLLLAGASFLFSLLLVKYSEKNKILFNNSKHDKPKSEFGKRHTGIDSIILNDKSVYKRTEMDTCFGKVEFDANTSGSLVRYKNKYAYSIRIINSDINKSINNVVGILNQEEYYTKSNNRPSPIGYFCNTDRVVGILYYLMQSDTLPRGFYVRIKSLECISYTKNPVYVKDSI